MSDELKPCPFCGGEATIKHVTQLWEPQNSYWAECASCHMSGKHHKTEAGAIEAWNTRTPEHAVAATLDGGECIPHGEWKRISQTQEVRHVFCECGYELGMDERDSSPFERTRLFAMPNYCQECGRKIRKAVKR